MPETTIPAPDAPAVILTLNRKEANALRAWMDATTPTRCGGEAGDDEHDAEGYGSLPGGICSGEGYCPGDLDALDRIADALSR